MREPRRRTALAADGHEDRHGHGCGHAEPNTADADGMWPQVRVLVDRTMMLSSASALAVVDRRPLCVTEPRDRDRLRDRQPLAWIVCVVRARREHGHSDLCQALRRRGSSGCEPKLATL